MAKALLQPNPLAFRCISQMDEQEAEDIAGKLYLPPENRKSKGKEYNLGKNQGKKIDFNDINFITQQTKIIAQVNPQWLEERPIKKNEDQVFQQPSRQQFRQHSNPNLTLKRNSSFIDEYGTDAQKEQENLREEYCRVWFEKLALQSHVANLERDTHRKDEIINQLKQELELKNVQQFNPQGSQPHSSSSHNKSMSHHPSFSLQNTVNPQQIQNAHWGSIHPARNFNINPSSNRNF